MSAEVDPERLAVLAVDPSTATAVEMRALVRMNLESYERVRAIAAAWLGASEHPVARGVAPVHAIPGDDGAPAPEGIGPCHRWRCGADSATAHFRLQELRHGSVQEDSRRAP